MDVKTIATFECEVVKKEYQLIGQSVTANFPQSFPDAAIKVQMDFEKRMGEVKNCKNKNVLISPYMCNDIVATYLHVWKLTCLPKFPKA